MSHREPSLVAPRIGYNMDKRRPRLLASEEDVLLKECRYREEKLRDALRHIRLTLLSGAACDEVVKQVNAALC